MVRLEHPSNIPDMSITLEVSKLVRFKLARLLQPRNILDISVTLVVSKQLPKSIFFIFEKLINIQEESGFAAIVPLAATYRWPLIIHASTLLSLVLETSQA